MVLSKIAGGEDARKQARQVTTLTVLPSPGAFTHNRESRMIFCLSSKAAKRRWSIEVSAVLHLILTGITRMSVGGSREPMAPAKLGGGYRE